MRFKAAVSLILALTLNLAAAFAVESTWEYSVQVSSTVQSSPAQITLSWPQDTNGAPSSYTIYRKAPGSTSWGSGTTLAGSANSYSDTSVSSGTAYEYRIVKAAGSYTGYGYIQAGINVPLADNRGKVVLVVDNSVASNLATELTRLQQDLAGDGWTVIRRDVGRSDSPASVKALIKSAYDSDPANVKSVFLFGHVPVPYSGQLNPDGHGDHVGAWPADVYYGDMDGSWTDSSVNYTQTVNTDPKDAARLTNLPGDGKFDQTTIPSSVELEVGRVDLSNLPGRTTWGGPATFASETELLRKYLNKDHAFRHAGTNTPRRAVVGDYFGSRGGEAFAASGFRSFAPLVGANNIRNLNVEFNDTRGVWIPQVAQNSYLLAYACGAGSYASIAGIGSGIYNGGDTVELVNSNVRGVFNLLFGSWLGDWDSEDNILRAPLATDSGLVSVWSGRPHWFMHPMGLGETVGYVARLTQNNAGLYQTAINSSENRIHIALMGDPTLRLHPVAPARSITGSLSGSTAALTWQASNDSAVVGYHVYRGASVNGPFTRLTSSPITALSFSDSSGSSSASYMVRAIKLESASSGSYQNASQGIFWSASGGSSSDVASTAPATSTFTPTVSVVTPTTSTTTVAAPTTTAPSTTSATTPTAPSISAGTVVWFDDALPAGASSTTWNWVSSSPAPFSGSKAHQTANVSGLHDYSFNWSTPLAVGTGEVIFAFVYLDAANPPSEIMLSWVSDSWEHRAYWGSNNIQYGTDNTAGRRNMGALPATGQWVRLAVPASAVGLEGASIQGMGLTLFNGRATLDYVGKADPNAIVTAAAATTSSSSDTTLWFDDALPAGAGSSGTWNWITANPAPFSGAKAHQTAIASGLHEYSFNWAAPLTVNTGEALVTNVYLDPANPPSEIMLSWVSDSWEHRAYWGSNNIQYGTDNTASRYNMGALPAAGQWVRLEVPASAVGLGGATVQGMGFSLFNGRATFDATGKSSTATAVVTTQTTTTASAPTSTATQPSSLTDPTLATTPSLQIVSSSLSTAPLAAAGSDTVWFDDALPAGAGGGATAGDAWTWVPAAPTPFSGSVAHQSNIRQGVHEHSFNWASDPLIVAAGEKLFAYVYLDSANMPTEIMVSWCSDNWEHRAFWGADSINYGKSNSASRYNAGALPAGGQWIRLEVPASAVGLEGATIRGMSFSLYDGRATWDKTGKSTAASTSTSTSSPTVASSSTASTIPQESVWIDDTLPAGATSGAGGGDVWNWVTSNPAPVAGVKSHQSSASAGLHEHFFNFATTPMTVATGDYVFAYVYLDPAAMPAEIMLSWCSDNWEHRAYWGADKIGYGTANTTGRYYAGALPAAGQWVRLEVPAKAVGLEGAKIQGMGFGQFDGRATWDKTGTATAAMGNSTAITTASTSAPAATTAPEVIWFDDAIPTGAGASANGGDAWNWVTSNPTPLSGSKAQQTVAAAGLHETAFNFAGATMSVAAGEPVFANVYVDPANVPSEIMLSWYDGTWEHRAYWGADKISYGTKGTAGRFYAGPMPAAGQWVRLAVPASAVALEGSTVQGMSFSLFDGRATFDKVGKGGAAAPAVVIASTTTPTTTTAPAPTPTTTIAPVTTTTVAPAPIVITSTPTTTTTTAPVTTTTTAPVATTTTTTTTPVTTTTTAPVATTTPTTTTTTTATTTVPTASAENSAFTLPKVGDNALTIISPTSLELRRITTKAADPAPVSEWNFVDASGTFTAPATSQFTVTVNGQAVAVKSVGFRRRVAYAPQNYRDLRIDNSLYLELASPIADGQAVEVKNASGALWPASMTFKSSANPLRYSPAIHVNQEGYIPSQSKKAMIGYYLGSMGELDVNPSLGFKIVSAATGASVFQGTLTSRLETGFVYAPKPYQKVLQADFSGFTSPGEYQLVIPGLGASLPFLINDGVAMAFTRTYALGIYSQRCGADNAMPYSRFIHAACHMLAAEVPSPQSSYGFTWTTIASKNEDAKTNPRHTAPRLDSEAAQLYPFVNKGKVDVSGGHHDAGDYSKYTINVAQLAHQLAFTAESVAGAGAMDNLGLPQSGDGISDILQEAKLEADFVAKLQDADGGFYFIVYPKTREYEGDVTPDRGDQQVVWPKNTSATAASVAALAQMASSPKFKAAYPAEAAVYLQKAKLGWTFLTNAIAKYGKDGSYQKVTFYGDHYMHDDELAWAAAEMFAATGEAQYHQKLMEWFPDPSDSNTFRWGWQRMSEAWGNAIRTYAFAVRSGRLQSSQLNAAYLAKCEEQIKLSGDDALNWSRQSAYGSSFPDASKRVLGAGWYFSLDQASEMAVAYQINPRPEYMDALIANMNYEAGTNPVNVMYVSGLGLKRQREIVNQWSNTDHRKMPMPGIPVGNITGTFSYLGTYGAVGNELGKLSYPTDDTVNTNLMTPFYDRWSDTWNVTAEFITMNQARSITSAATIASVTSAKSTAWKPTTTVQIVTPTTTVQVGAPLKLTLATSGLDLSNARILWEARDQEPDFGSTYTVTPKNPGAQWVEVEITWADGRRMVGTGSFNANSALVTWLDDAIPNGGNPGSVGGDGWNWVSNPTPQVGAKVHQTPAGTGLREHSFTGAWSPLTIGTGDTLFAWVYLDAAAMPEEIMLHWNDGTWEHRAFWGANKIGYGTDGTAGRINMGALPAGGGWVKLEVRATLVGLEGREVTGMCFSTFGGGVVSWDAAGRTSPMN